MSKRILLADAHDAVEKAVADCNAVAGKLLAETTAYKNRDVEWILAADVSRVMELAADLSDARERLAKAKAELEQLRRRMA